MFTIAKKVDGSWKYFASRTRWVDRPVLSGIFLDTVNAFGSIDILPDGDEIGCVVIPLTITVDVENPITRT